MISTLAVRITEALCAASAIEESDKELYQYGFFLLLSHVLFFLLTAFLGLLFRVPAESIMFYTMFSLLRSYAGGIHAKTETLCILLTSLSMFISVASIFVMKLVHALIVPVGMLVVGVLCILILSPLDTREKPLSKAERKRYRCASWLLAFGFAVLSLVGVAVCYPTVLYAVAVAIFMEGCLLALGGMIHD